MVKELPIYCYDCPCHNGENGRCNITGDSAFDKRPFDCPLKEVKLADLPPAQPERKKGRWIGKPIAGYCTVRCSVCNNVFRENNGRWNFCPNCGAEMMEKTDD